MAAHLVALLPKGKALDVRSLDSAFAARGSRQTQVIMALSALAAYAGVVDGYTSSVFFIAALCALIAIPCSGVWLLFGASLSRLLRDPRVTRPFNWTMAALLVASIAPILFE